jgi:uncharacterized protein (TIGR02466 family)|tara:strand:+ start:214 stop:1833 length:1620 start_codon:yes stop_codon:yes gene_type:complete
MANLKPNLCATQHDLEIVNNCISKGEYKEAFTQLDNLSHRYPNDPTLFLLGGNCYIALSHFDQAILCYQEAIKIKPGFSDAHNNLGICFYESGRWDEAILCYQEAIKIKPDFADAHNNLGICLRELGDINEAILSAKKSVKISPALAEAHNNLGICFFESGQLNEALLSYQKALKIKPLFADAHNNIGNIFKANGQVDKAIKSFKTAIELDSNCKSAYGCLASTYEELGQDALAMKYYELQRGINEDFAQAMTLFGGENYGEAAKFFEKSQFADWQDKVLESLYRNSEFDLFKEKLFEFSKGTKHIRRTVAALSAHYAENFKTKDPYNFCPAPLGFVCHEQIPELLENNQHLIKELIKDIKMAGVLKRKYQFLAHGTAVEQSGGHIFKRPETSFKKLHDALISSIKRYYLQHQNKDNEFIRSFPNKIHFSSSWSIEMKSGGHLGAHNHPEGWVSGAIYLAVPKNNGTDGQEGGIELSSDFHQLPNLHDEFEKMIIVPNEGDVVFFPSPMYHRTIPFKSNEERICIAFDLKHDIRRFGFY